MTHPQPDNRTADRLWAEYARTRDPKIRDRIVTHFERLAYAVAHRYSRGVKDEDLFQVALLGLMKAVDRFDPATHYRFSTFAVPTIAGEISHYFRDHAWQLRVPRSLQETYQKARRARTKLTERFGRFATDAEIAGRLDLSEEQVREALTLEELNHPVSLDGDLETCQPGSTTGGKTNLARVLGSEDLQLRRQEEAVGFAQALGRLSAPLAEVIRLRYREEMTQREVGRQLGMSAMTVCRMERRALHLLRQQFTAA